MPIGSPLTSGEGVAKEKAWSALLAIKVSLHSCPRRQEHKNLWNENSFQGWQAGHIHWPLFYLHPPEDLLHSTVKECGKKELIKWKKNGKEDNSNNWQINGKNLNDLTGSQMWLFSCGLSQEEIWLTLSWKKKKNISESSVTGWHQKFLKTWMHMGPKSKEWLKDYLGNDQNTEIPISPTDIWLEVYSLERVKQVIGLRGAKHS